MQSSTKQQTPLFSLSLFSWPRANFKSSPSFHLHCKLIYARSLKHFHCKDYFLLNSDLSLSFNDCFHLKLVIYYPCDFTNLGNIQEISLQRNRPIYKKFPRVGTYYFSNFLDEFGLGTRASWFIFGTKRMSFFKISWVSRICIV